MRDWDKEGAQCACVYVRACVRVCVCLVPNGNVPDRVLSRQGDAAQQDEEEDEVGEDVVVHNLMTQHPEPGGGERDRDRERERGSGRGREGGRTLKNKGRKERGKEQSVYMSTEFPSIYSCTILINSR